jgi:multiple sugar transport system permease protein
MKHGSRIKRFWKENGSGYLFISPWLIGFLIFTGYPFLRSIYLSFTAYDIVTAPRWVGAANYKTLLTDDPKFYQSLMVTVHYAIIAVPLSVVSSLILALLLSASVRGQSIFRTIFYLPGIVPAVANAIVFNWLLNPEMGLVNRILALFGIRGPAWMQDARWAPYTFILMSLWGVGSGMIIYLAALKDVPAYLYEAALIDGADPWQRLRAITLPTISPVIFFNLVMGVIGSFQYFTEAYVMTHGGPDGSTTFYALYLFQRAWEYLDMGYASAMAWVLFVVVMIVTGVMFKLQDRWVKYGN